MRNLFVVRKRELAIFCVIVLLAPFIAWMFQTDKTAIPKPEYTIVIDAGHGGRDVK